MDRQQALQELISLFLKINPQPSDQQFHALAEAAGVDKEELEAISYGMLSEAEEVLSSDIGEEDEDLDSNEKAELLQDAEDQQLDDEDAQDEEDEEGLEVDEEVAASIHRVNARARLMADQQDVLDDPTLDPDHMDLADVALNDGDPTDDDLGQQEETMDDGYTTEDVGVGLSNNANDVLTDDGVPDTSL